MKTEENNEQNEDLTGFENTGETDTFGQIEEAEKVEAPKKEETTDTEEILEEDPKDKEVSEEAKIKLQKKAEEDQKEEGAKLSKENEDEIHIFDKEGDDDTKEEVKKEGDDKKEDEKDEEEPEMFSTKELEEELENEKDVKETSKTVDWKKIAGSIKLPEDLKINIEDDSLDGFKSAVKKSIENAQTKTVFDIEKFEEPQQEVINYFLNGGKKEDLLSPLKEIDDVLVSDPEVKALNYFIGAEDLSEKDAQEKVNELIESDGLDNQIKIINKELYDLRESRYQEVIKQNSDTGNQISENKKNETKAMSDYVNNMTEFMGTKLPDNVKTYLKKEIETGKLAEKNNNAESQIIARLFTLYGNQILKKMQDEAKNASRESYNKGLEKEKRKVHNVPPKKQTQTAVEQKKQTDIIEPLALFKNFDEDAIETD